MGYEIKTINEVWGEKISQLPRLFINAGIKKAKPHSAPSLKPPKGWMRSMVAKIKKRGGVKDPEAVAGKIWYKQMSSKDRSKKRKAEGKEYGTAPKVKKSRSAVKEQEDNDERAERMVGKDEKKREYERNISKSEAETQMKNTEILLKAYEDGDFSKSEVKEASEILSKSIYLSKWNPRGNSSGNQSVCSDDSEKGLWSAEFKGTDLEEKASSLEKHYTMASVAKARLELMCDQLGLQKRLLEFAHDTEKAK